MTKMLVVDDEIGIRESLSDILRDEGHDVVLAENAAARPDLVLLDIWMPIPTGSRCSRSGPATPNRPCRW